VKIGLDLQIGSKAGFLLPSCTLVRFSMQPRKQSSKQAHLQAIFCVGTIIFTDRNSGFSLTGRSTSAHSKKTQCQTIYKDLWPVRNSSGKRMQQRSHCCSIATNSAMGDLTRFYEFMELQNHPHHTEMSLKRD
jgi:hypothetical protein